MTYYYNESYGVLIYPDNWFDTLRCLFTWILHPSFKRTWKGNPYWYKPHVAGCIEKKLEKTSYPDEACAG